MHFDTIAFFLGGVESFNNERGYTPFDMVLADNKSMYKALSFYKRSFMKSLSRKKWVSTWLALGIIVASCFALSREVQTSAKKTRVNELANVLDVSASPTERTNDIYDTNYLNNFSDLGIRYGYYLPEKSDKELLGGFTGPLIIVEEHPVNLATSSNKSTVKNKKMGETYDPSQSNHMGLSYYPRRLE